MASTQTTTARYNVRPYTPEDESQVLDLMEASLGTGPTGRRDPDAWRWKHMTNPFGASYVYLAHDERGQVAGMRAFMQWRFQAGGQPVRAVRAVDTATHPDHQRRGIFTMLTLHTLHEVEKDGVGMVFNTPNQQSMPGYLKMGWTHVGAFQPMVLALNPARFLLGLARYRLRRGEPRQYSSDEIIKPSVTPLSEVLDISEGLERLLSAHRDSVVGGSLFSTPRTAKYLHWRYAQHPYIGYYASHSGSEANPKGMVIFRPNTRFGMREVVLCELLLAERDERTCRELVRQLRSSVRADYVVAHFRRGSFQHEALRRCGFRPVPRAGMNFTSRPLRQDLPADPLRLDSWDMSLGDLEIF